MLQDLWPMIRDCEAGRICSDEPEEGDMCEPIRPYVLNDWKLVCYPNAGEGKVSVEFMKRCEPKQKLDRPILSLDFKM